MEEAEDIGEKQNLPRIDAGERGFGKLAKNRRNLESKPKGSVEGRRWNRAKPLTRRHGEEIGWSG